MNASFINTAIIKKKIKENIKNYVRLVDKEYVYELIGSDAVVNEYEMESHLETKVFVSKLVDGKYRHQTTVDIMGRTASAKGGLYITDVDFDGKKDILVKCGHFGAQGMVRYSCFLNRKDGYRQCESFSQIPNVSIDKENKKILGTWRNWAASHSWAMYSFRNGKFIETDRLTEELARPQEGEEEVWKYSIEKLVGKKMKNFDEKSEWGLYSKKWQTLNNLGAMIGFSIYGDGINASVSEVITNE